MSLKEHVSNSMKKTAEDLNSNRVRVTYIMLALYCYIAIHVVRNVPEALITLIQVTGGVVTVAFTGYLFSKNAEKKRDALLNSNGDGGIDNAG